MLNIGIFGGYFNPPHNGHVNLMKNVMDIFSFDKVMIIPSYIPPHKEIYGNINASQRFEMCRLAFSGCLFEVSDIELRRKGKSYTYDTLLQIKEAYNCRVSIIIGSDMLLMFDKWYRYRDILNISDVIAACRYKDCSEYDDLSAKARQLNLIRATAVTVCRAEPFEISSTQIRQKVRNHENISGFVPGSINEYIIDGGLYND